MQKSDSRWKFSISVLLPVIAAVVVTLALAAGFVVWSAQQTDSRALGRQQGLAARAVDTAKRDFARTLLDQDQRWDVVDTFTSGKPAHDDLDNYFGEDEYDTYGHDRVYVLDPSLSPVYAARNGQSASPKIFDADHDTVAPLAAELQTPEMVAQIEKYQNGDQDWPPQISDFAILGGKVAMVSVLPIVSNWDDQTQKSGTWYYHVAVEFIGGKLAQQMAGEYLLDNVHFDTAPETVGDETMVPIQNAAGRFVAYFKWLPDRPGRALLEETLPASLGLVAVVGLIIALLLFGLARSTKALEKARAEALYRATHDPLTGLANRALFADRLEHSPLPLTLLALDLDRFKQVNDTFGHEAGDELLRQVAARLTPLVRDGDLVARLGGDEFMILLSGAIEPKRVEELARRIVTSIAAPFYIGEETASIGISVGIASAVTDERKELVTRADFALYDAKEAGRNTFRVFDELKEAA